ncbi:MAG TPA: PAS domain S-box protein, partial [Actinomycetes bacterium]|nr:PAS domain S-box protein [Actinomycetes bacterium]
LVQAGVTGYVLTGEHRYLLSYEAARRELPQAVVRLRVLVSDNPGQVDRLERVRALVDQRADLLEALVANVRAGRPAATRAELLDRNKESADALIAQLEAMQAEEQRLLAGRQAQARRTRTLALGAIGLSVLLGIAGGIAAVLLFTSGVTRRAARLEENAERLAGGLPLLPPLPEGDALGKLGRGLERAAVLLGEREQALRDAQALLEHIVAWSPMVMFRGLLGGRGERYISGNVERLLGYTQEQVLRTPAFWIVQLHPADRDGFTDKLERAVAERAPQVEQEYRFLFQDGYHWLYGVTRLVYDEHGALADTLSYAMDVTERKQADDALREREATLQAVIDASPDIISILDAEGAVRSMSPAAQRILGLRADTSRGHSALDGQSIHPDDLERFAGAQRQVLRGERESAAVRIRVRHAQGHWLTLEAHSRPLAAPDGLLIVSRDVTKQAKLEEDLRMAKLAAEQANEAKSEYLSRMSHELRTPLNAILGFAQLLDLDDLGDDQRVNLGHIMSGARHLLSLINEVLDIAAIEAGRLSLSLEPVALAGVAAETVSLIRPLADKHHVVLAGPNVSTPPTSSATASGSSRSCSTCSPTRSSTTVRAAASTWTASRCPAPGCASRSPTPGRASRPRPSSGCSSRSSGWPASRAPSRAPGWACRCPSAWPRPWAAPWSCRPLSARAAASGSSSPWPSPPASRPSASSRRSRPPPSRPRRPGPTPPSSTSRTTCPTSSWSSGYSATVPESG